VFQDGSSRRLMDTSSSTRYVYSLYWAIAIIETIGYGDIAPVQNMTVVMLIVVMLTGVFVFGFLMGNVASIVSLFDGLQKKSSIARDEASKTNRRFL
jgi:hypothetical protein